MLKVISSERTPIKLWLDDIEEGAMSQARNLANLPFAFHHIALMPDAHSGFGMPIGGVLATQKVVIPNAVGVDIGCGMCAMKTNLHSLDSNTLKDILRQIQHRVPVGADWHKRKQDEDLMPRVHKLPPITFCEYENALYQLGTLGGGNHFIEIQKGSDGFIWAMVHSGSRNIGKQVADHYNRLARKLNERWHSEVPRAWDLAYLPIDSDEAQDYLDEMQYCVNFALANRKLMMEFIRESFDNVLRGKVQFEDMLNIAHNYAVWEKHYNEHVLVHRKGATRAGKGEIGIIPGSQGTKSFIVEGLGNPESFLSSSHGAGRRMGRRQAMRELDLQTEIKRLDEKGIIHSVRKVRDLDEAAGAYKDIDKVMENQRDLVQIKIKLEPLGVIKG